MRPAMVSVSEGALVEIVIRVPALERARPVTEIQRAPENGTPVEQDPERWDGLS